MFGVSDAAREFLMNVCFEGARSGNAEGEHKALQMYGELLAEGKIPSSRRAHAYIVGSCERATRMILPGDDPRSKRLQELMNGVKEKERDALSEAVMLLQDIANQSRVARDERRQQGTRKSRGSRMPALDAWISAALEQHPAATVAELWERLRAEGQDGLKLYMDGERVIELVKGREKETGFPGFKKRVEIIRNL